MYLPDRIVPFDMTRSLLYFFFRHQRHVNMGGKIFERLYDTSVSRIGIRLVNRQQTITDMETIQDKHGLGVLCYDFSAIFQELLHEGKPQCIDIRNPGVLPTPKQFLFMVVIDQFPRQRIFKLIMDRRLSCSRYPFEDYYLNALRRDDIHKKSIP